MVVDELIPGLSKRSCDFAKAMTDVHFAFSASERVNIELYKQNKKLRELVDSYANMFDRWAAENNGNGPYFSGEDWLALANDMRIDLAECCGELGIEENQ